MVFFVINVYCCQPEMMRSPLLLLLLLLTNRVSMGINQSPPVQVGDTNQYVLTKVNTEINLTCPFTNVQFYKWHNLKSPTNIIFSENQDLKIKVTSYTKSEIYECEAVNGYGKKTGMFIAKGIDINSKQFNIDCQSRDAGPCFLVSGINNDIEFSVEENSKIAMDCRAVTNSSTKRPLSYSWKKMPSPESFEIKLQNSLSNQRIQKTGRFLDDVPPIGKIEYNSVDDMSKWGPIVLFEKVTKAVDGLYECLVSNSVDSIRRTFRIRVEEIKSVRTIEGPQYQNITAAVGSTQILNCKAFSKPKWGKKLGNTEETTESEEIIKWGGSRYKMLQGSLDIEHRTNGGSVKDSNFYTNNLKLENIQQSHSGIYVCSVLTSSTLEHKYVNLSVDAGTVFGDGVKKNNNFPIYIAVPTTVFIICFATIIYCLIHRRIRQKANFKNRAVRGTTATTTNSSSGNGSCSGSRNTSNPRHHMLTTTTNSSKGSQNNQFTPNSCFSGNNVPVSGYPTFSAGYTPAVMNYNYTGPGPYIPNPNNIEQCSHHNCMTYNGHPVPYDSDSTPSPPPPTSITDTVSTSAINPNNHNGLAPYSMNSAVGGGSLVINSYSPNQSSQIFIPNQTPHGSSSTSVSSPSAMYQVNQQQQPHATVYPVGVMYSA